VLGSEAEAASQHDEEDRRRREEEENRAKEEAAAALRREEAARHQLARAILCNDLGTFVLPMINQYTIYFLKTGNLAVYLYWYFKVYFLKLFDVFIQLNIAGTRLNIGSKPLRFYLISFIAAALWVYGITRFPSQPHRFPKFRCFPSFHSFYLYLP